MEGAQPALQTRDATVLGRSRRFFSFPSVQSKAGGRRGFHGQSLSCGAAGTAFFCKLQTRWGPRRSSSLCWPLLPTAVGLCGNGGPMKDAGVVSNLRLGRTFPTAAAHSVRLE